VSTHLEGPATGQLDQGFPWFSSVLQTDRQTDSHNSRSSLGPTDRQTVTMHATLHSRCSIHLVLQCCVVALTLSGRPVSADTRARSQDSPSGIYGGRSGTGTGFFILELHLCQNHPTNAPHSSSSTCCSYQKDKRVKPGSLPKQAVILRNPGSSA
jgi:hypothetical protein